MTTAKLVAYYAPQRRAVEWFAIAIGGGLAGMARSAYDLRGVDGGTFIEASNHPEPVPADIRELLRVRGWTVITIDDSFAREHAERNTRDTTSQVFTDAATLLSEIDTLRRMLVTANERATRAEESLRQGTARPVDASTSHPPVLVPVNWRAA